MNCKYCNSEQKKSISVGKWQMQGDLGLDNVEMYLTKRKDSYHIRVYQENYHAGNSTIINYCPMCGRKL